MYSQALHLEYVARKGVKTNENLGERARERVRYSLNSDRRDVRECVALSSTSHCLVLFIPQVTGDVRQCLVSGNACFLSGKQVRVHGYPVSFSLELTSTASPPALCYVTMVNMTIL